ncbi:cupin domain-containing protein [Desulfovibrio sp. OttesenSCG-928-I05]|nr:cupin domain-containing protein [Desulfovibrio sp. OttesenSCG-928-I05]
MRFTVEPGCGQLSTDSHSGEEVVHVLDGTIEFMVHDARYTMNTGDSLHFNAHQLHS